MTYSDVPIVDTPKKRTEKYHINEDYVAGFIAGLMIFTIYYFSLDTTLIYLPVCVLLARIFFQSQNKNLNRALYGSLGSVLLWATCFYIVSSAPEKEAGLVMVNLISCMAAICFWFVGYDGIKEFRKEDNPLKKSGAAYFSYVLIFVSGCLTWYILLLMPLSSVVMLLQVFGVF